MGTTHKELSAPGLAGNFTRRAARLKQIAQAMRSKASAAGVTAAAATNASAAAAAPTTGAAAADGQASSTGAAWSGVLDGLSVPTHLHAYAPAAFELYEELDRAQRQLEDEVAKAAVGEAPSLPTLRWDTSVLDIEEDRVIWVRETDLGQAVRLAEEQGRDQTSWSSSSMK